MSTTLRERNITLRDTNMCTYIQNHVLVCVLRQRILSSSEPHEFSLQNLLKHIAFTLQTRFRALHSLFHSCSFVGKREGGGGWWAAFVTQLAFVMGEVLLHVLEFKCEQYSNEHLCRYFFGHNRYIKIKILIFIKPFRNFLLNINGTPKIGAANKKPVIVWYSDYHQCGRWNLFGVLLTFICDLVEC